MSEQSKVGDMGVGVCPCHLTPVAYTTVFISGASSVLTNGQPTAIVGTIGIASCGHPTVALTGLSSVKPTSQNTHRVGDVGTNCGPYITVSGSSNVKSGG
jgi:hypothetical protein